VSGTTPGASPTGRGAPLTGARPAAPPPVPGARIPTPSAAGSPMPGAGDGAARPAQPGRRRARLSLTRIDPLSVAKVALVLATGLAVAFVVAITLLYVLFAAAGVFDTVSRTINDVAGSQIDAGALLGFGRIIGITLLVAVIQVVLTTALATLVAMLYNLAAYFVGGINVTLTESD
jgi:hypothetical protein